MYKFKNKTFDNVEMTKSYGPYRLRISFIKDEKEVANIPADFTCICIAFDKIYSVETILMEQGADIDKHEKALCYKVSSMDFEDFYFSIR